MDKLAAEPGCNDNWRNYISSCSLVKMKKLYGFDNFKKYNFVKVEFKNMMAFNKVKNFWYTNHKNFTKRKLRKNGYLFERTKTNLILYYQLFFSKIARVSSGFRYNPLYVDG